MNHFGNSTAVYQNENSTALFVPNAPSLSRLFVDVIRDTGLQPQDVSLVEAHGTGTPVGDPAEYQGIRQALGGTIRTKPLPIGSVKGLIGHTESSSGIVSLIKIVTLMQENFIPAQASYAKLSHRIDASAEDMIEVPTSLRPWTEWQKTVRINNYGASGSNASMIVRQAPYYGQVPTASLRGCKRQPFWIPGLNGRSVEAYCAKLLQFVKKSMKRYSLADISFNVARQSKRTFTHGLIFSCASVPELVESLSSVSAVHVQVPPARPVIICFGGQVSKVVGLNRKLYESVQILRKHLDECDAIIRSLGLESLFPTIFTKEMVTGIVKLQTMLFALQYTYAKCWMDCDVKVEAVVGHSFGEITALCISGVLSPINAIRLIVGRAKIVRDAWDPDPGSMIAVEADLSLVRRLLAEANANYEGSYPASIACYNGSQSFTLAGSSQAIDVVEKTIAVVNVFAAVKSKRLNVTHAFHSTLVDPLLGALGKVAQDITFNDPVISLERSTETRSTSSRLTPRFVSDHMREPVFFSHAVQRLAKDHPSCVWLEAGSATTITTMANRALGSVPGMHFQALNVTCESGMENLSDATVAFWKAGIRVAFWSHHSVQAPEYAPILLPPYQFEKSRHWLEFKPVANAFPSQRQPEVLPREENVPLGLWTFKGFQDAQHRHARFRINTESKPYKSFIMGHVAVQTAPICPATLEIDMAIEALRSLLPESESSLNLQPVVHRVQNHMALCMDPTKEVWLDLKASGSLWWDCKWKIVTDAPDTTEILCVEGRIELRSPEDEAYHAEFSRFERLVS